MKCPRLASTCCALAMVGGVTSALAAQGGTTVDLGKRNARSKYTLGHLVAVQELPDGRVVASDAKEQVFRLVDFARGDVGLVGKPGDDPEDYRSASLVLRREGDSLALYDPAGRKLLHVTPQGTITDAVPLPAPVLADHRRLGALLGADSAGALFFTTGEQFDTATRALSGIASVVRVARGGTAVEPELTYRTRRSDQTRPAGIMPYPFRDAVAIRPDGLIARVIADTYQVVWYRGGGETGHTGPLPNQPITISAADQQAYRDSTIAAMKAMTSAGRGGAATGPGRGSGMADDMGGGGGGMQTVIINGGGGGAAPAVMIGGGAGGGGDAQRMIINGVDVSSSVAAGGGRAMSAGAFDPANLPFGAFPDVKPAILSSGTVASFDASGRLWVARERERGDAIPRYDVIVEGRGVIARIDLPTGTRLVGFGHNAVYLARNEDGSDWLERYPMPRLP